MDIDLHITAILKWGGGVIRIIHDRIILSLYTHSHKARIHSSIQQRIVLFEPIRVRTADINVVEVRGQINCKVIQVYGTKYFRNSKWLAHLITKLAHAAFC